MLQCFVKQVRAVVPRFLGPHREDGQDLAEYAVTLAMVALLVIAAVLLLRYQIANTFNVIVQGLAVNGIGS